MADDMTWMSPRLISGKITPSLVPAFPTNRIFSGSKGRGRRRRECRPGTLLGPNGWPIAGDQAFANAAFARQNGNDVVDLGLWIQVGLIENVFGGVYHTLSVPVYE
jgi:hypothetical protein